MRDTFTSVFPNYTHAKKSVYQPSTAHRAYLYPEQNIDGKPMHIIDRTHNLKLDFLKRYTEEILKISNMRRNTK